MKRATDFRRNARGTLRGKWGITIIATLIASLLGGLNTTGSITFNINFPTDSFKELSATIQSGAGLEEFEEITFESIISSIPKEVFTFLGVFLAFALTIGLIVGLAFFILGSIINVGYASFALDIDDGLNGDIGSLFSYFKHWRVCVLSNLLRKIYAFLWSLLLVVPGIIARYSYAMVPYIIAENPETTASEALKRSKLLMSGNRWKLFCLEISFIGWWILCVLSLGIGFIWLNPYFEIAMADFYREISSTRPKKDYIDPDFDFVFERK